MFDTYDFIMKNSIGKCFTNVDLKRYTTYKAGGTCKYLAYPKNISKLVLLLKTLKTNKIKYKILGNGSNTLFNDTLYDGVIIKLDSFNSISFNRTKVKVGAGYSLVALSTECAKRSLTGLEFASGIPGTVGGAVYMNAGAYKSDMGYVVENIRVLTPKLEVITLTNKELQFHYRTSFLKTHPGYICLDVTIKLQKGDKEAIKEVIRDRRERRIASQPLEYPSCGSVFRNPEGMFAGKLIEDCGLKGYRIGGAMVSEKHANFIINYDHATGKDLHDLILYVHDEVLKKFNVDLKIEQEFVNWE